VRIEGRGTAPAGPPVTIRFDGTPVSAFEGEAVALNISYSKSICDIGSLRFASAQRVIF
jgi:hypothetical protein